MKKWIALLLAVIMTFSLVGCASGPEILGTYAVEYDLTEQFVSEFDATLAYNDLNISIGDYLDHFAITLIFEFKEDGTYTASVDLSSLDAAMADLADAMLPLLEDMLISIFRNEAATYGLTVETKEDVEGMFGMSWEEIFPFIYNCTAEELAQMMVDETYAEFNPDDYAMEGLYKAKGGKLYTTVSLDEELPTDAYETYEINGDTVTITGGVNVEENSNHPYPYTLTKVSE